MEENSGSLENALKHFFGYNAFRQCQEEIVTAILQRKDVLAILPTGAGKSICYQLPALMMPGIAVVISPLISLMQDQVVSLSKNGIAAAFLNSSLHYSEIHSLLHNLKSYKLLYIAPERFADPNFLQALQETEVSLFAIDEAHCISQWGHSFRPDYRQLSLIKEKFPKSPIIALTATATKDVERDILNQLHMQEPTLVRASFDRPNLTFHVHAKSSSDTQLHAFLSKHVDQSGILYAATRKVVDETYEKLLNQGFKVGKYHAGLSDAERSKMQHDFVHGEVPLIVATVAFGMGIHKPDIRFIVHLDMPRSLEQYYQEVGRAGRDGLPAECLMLYSAKELMVYQSFLDQISDKIVRQTTKMKTEKMYQFCHSASCRRKELLRYFGETYPLAHCNGCDNCLDHTDLLDETIAAQKILSCIYRLQERFGVRHVVDVLRGAKTKAILERRHELLSTYGIMSDYSTEDLCFYIDTLIASGFLKRSEETYPVLQWTQTSSQLIKGAAQFLIRKKSRKIAERKQKMEPEYDKALFQQLSDLRRTWAKETHVPAFVVLSDRTLIEMATHYPRTRQAMLALNGFGPIKWEKYGTSFLTLITQYCDERAIPPPEIPMPHKKSPPLDKPRELHASSKETARLFSHGLTLAEIANQRNLSVGTLIEHICQQITLGSDIDITPLVSPEKQQLIREVIQQVGAEKLNPIKNALPEEFTYEEIKLVGAFYRRKPIDLFKRISL